MIKGLITGSNGIIILLVGLISYFAISDKFSIKKVAKQTIEISRLEKQIEIKDRKVWHLTRDSLLMAKSILELRGMVVTQVDSIKKLSDSLVHFKAGYTPKRKLFGGTKWIKNISFENNDNQADKLADDFMDYCNEHRYKAGVVYQLNGFLNKKSN